MVKNACEDPWGIGYFHSHIPKNGWSHVGAIRKAAYVFSIKDFIRNVDYVPSFGAFEKRGGDI